MQFLISTEESTSPEVDESGFNLSVL